jgi:L-lactate dehydrogenase complex protein LldG
MNERDAILARIREALARPSIRPGAGPIPHLRAAAPHADGPNRWLPKAGETFTERLDLFRANAAQLKAEFHLLATPTDVAARVQALRDAGSWSRIASHSGRWSDLACGAAALPVVRTDSPFDRNALETCDAAITECDALIAQTGSVLVTGRSAGGRALSVLPPHHVVIATAAQLVPDLPTAFELLKKKYAPDYPSFISLITGPSRTGDIERILVLGAHGPRQLTILCVQEPA